MKNFQTGFIAFFLFLISWQTVVCQKPSFQRFLMGVNKAIVVIDDFNYEKIQTHEILQNIVKANISYLESIGIQNVVWTKKSSLGNNLNSESICDYVFVYPSFNYTSDLISNLGVKYIGCGGIEYFFSGSDEIWVTGYNDYFNSLLKFYKKTVGISSRTYDVNERLVLPSIDLEWPENKIVEYLDGNNARWDEGIYESVVGTSLDPKYRLSLKYINSEPYLIYHSGAKNSQDWIDGELKGTLIKTATPNLYKCRWLMGIKTPNENVYVKVDAGYFTVIMGENRESMYLKMYPTAQLGNHSELISSGTGFAVNSSGYILTNYHVIENGKAITIKGVAGDFQNSYKAEVVLTDKNNDLALLKIIDSNFKSFGNIPYPISRNPVDVGTSVFALGYPLRSTMGDEIKLVNGIISSKSGFQGDITTYQSTLPVQPGNSGGPVFDNKGNIVAVVNALHENTDNVSYSVKSSFIFSLIESMNSPISVASSNSISTLSLVEQVKILKKFVYIIEVR